jgi:hypothetical protein
MVAFSPASTSRRVRDVFFCEVRPPLVAMHAAQRVEQPVRVIAVALVQRGPTVRVDPMRAISGGTSLLTEYPPRRLGASCNADWAAAKEAEQAEHRQEAARIEAENERKAAAEKAAFERSKLERTSQ